MGAAVGVDAGLRNEGWCIARVGRDDGGITEVGGVLGCRCKLRTEFTERQELSPVTDETKGRDVPKGCRSAIAEDDLVAIGEGKQISQSRAQAPHL